MGYGRMGREIEAIARSRSHEIVARIDPADGEADFASVDTAVASGAVDRTVVVIEFALAEGLADRMAVYATAGCGLVLGTTGWEPERERIVAAATAAGLPMVWGANFSVGANMFVRIAGYAAGLAARTGAYDAGMVELHHRGKKDSPSGTALMLAEEILRRSEAKTAVQTEVLHRQIEAKELHIASGRIGSIPGTHTVHLDSVADTVELTHRARNRSGFALGAVQAAEWVVERPGVHTVDEFFDYLFQDG